jgi:hypothetical protein
VVTFEPSLTTGTTTSFTKQHVYNTALLSGNMAFDAKPLMVQFTNDSTATGRSMMRFVKPVKGEGKAVKHVKECPAWSQSSLWSKPRITEVVPPSDGVLLGSRRRPAMDVDDDDEAAEDIEGDGEDDEA